MSHSPEITFEMRNTRLSFDPERSILVCRQSGGSGKKLWAKKIFDIGRIEEIIEDALCYYLAGASGETSGRLLALDKKSGNTAWFIAGKSVLQVLYQGHLFSIFIDDTDAYYLVKIGLERGEVIWHHRVGSDLSEYHFAGDRITLDYSGGDRETLSIQNGSVVSKTR
ncbi:MAG TPA: hypothetical protein PLE73_11260 [Spirochaetota bacterium]|nr:hypothetical protein [Spirochaetota bacterium]HPI23769.1 hypothetical protein [Spirochaetota bacterium]HPU89826.1 hypothetical protein [Spirochaetota bacterium]